MRGAIYSGGHQQNARFDFGGQIKLMQDQISGPGYPIFDFQHSGPHPQKCRMIGHCNETTWNIGLKLHKAPLLYICSSYAELYCLDRPGKNRLFFVSRKA